MLRPTFMGFEIAKRGITTSQKGLDITGQNMTNWESQGYTRQRIDQVAISPSAYSTRFATDRIGVSGQGVDINGIAQIRDDFLDRRFREEYSDEGYFAQVTNILSDIESAIGEFNPLSEAGVRGSFETMFPALLEFADQPYSETHANIIKTEITNFTQTLQQLSSKLDSVEGQQKFNLQTMTADVNTKLQELANVNYAISQDLGLTVDNEYYGPNELYDQQNLILDELSQLLDFSYERQSDGTVTLSVGDVVAVEGKNYEVIEYNEHSNDTVSLTWKSSGDNLSMHSGALKGAVDYINGRGPNVMTSGETPVKGIPYYRDRLNTLANTFASVVNSAIPDTFDADGNPTSYKTLMGGISDIPDANGNYLVSSSIPVTAENISISNEWIADSSYIISKEDNKDNNYIYGLYSALSLEDQTFTSPGESFTGTFYEYVDDYAATLAEEITYTSGRHTASLTIVSDLQDSRDSVSGVVMDEEVTNMMMYNKSFQAASRFMTTLDEALDVLINRTGLVGR